MCSVEGCSGPHFGRGLCNLHYYRQVRSPKRVRSTATCEWCGETKTVDLMRHPDASRGKTPSTCHKCRESHPDLHWCDFHGEPHPKSAFQRVPQRPIGYANECKQAAVIKASRKRGHAPIECAVCKAERESWMFRGGRSKCPTCRMCESSRPDEAWCIDCESWLPRDMFTRTGRGGAWLTTRCRPCRTAHAHGVTVKQILKRQGTSGPECGSCGGRDFLKIDHDHTCCPSKSGCPKCVRGYLCHECNTAEGLLRTSERARKLVAYMERFDL